MTQSANRDDDLRDDDPYELWDAAYVLGSLSGTDRHEFEAHHVHGAGLPSLN